MVVGFSSYGCGFYIVSRVTIFVISWINGQPDGGAEIEKIEVQILLLFRDDKCSKYKTFTCMLQI